MSIASFVNFGLRHLRALIVVPFAFAVIGLVVAILLGRTHTAYSSLIPEKTDPALVGGLSSIASQFGVSLAGSEASADFYRAIVYEQSTVRKLAETKFEFDAEGEKKSGRLIDILEIDAPDDHLRWIVADEVISSMISAKAVFETGILEIRTTADWRPLAEAMNRRILELIDEFNDERRRKRATAEREFVETVLLKRAQDELNAAEGALRYFLENNRTYLTSPTLVFEAGRLQRVVDLKQQIYVAIAQGLEQTRMEQLRRTPQVTVISTPEGTASRSRRLPIILAFAFMGTVLTLLWAVLVDWIGRIEPGGSPGYDTIIRWARRLGLSRGEFGSERR